MEFGKVDPHALSLIDFKLPPDHARTKQILSSSKKNITPKIYVGCAKWGRTDWVGKIYPKGTKAVNFLDEYAKQFNCIEFNSIYYGLPPKTQINAWKNKVDESFKFCPKFTEVITHEKKLKNVEHELAAFVDTVRAFDKNLGPIFFMPHPQMGPEELPTIFSFLNTLPPDLNVFCEFRHPAFFIQPNADFLFDKLEKLKRGSVITDASGRRDCVHMRLTTPQAFIRFVGNGLHKTDYERIDDWVQRIKQWIEQGLQTCYFFMHQHEELHSPELCHYLVKELNRHCGLSLHVPRFITAQPELFD